MDIVLITRDRPELTEQTIRSMRENAVDWSKHRLVVVYDGSASELVLARMFKTRSPIWSESGVASVLLNTGRQIGVGGAKNFGAAWLLEHKYRPETPAGLLVFTDNDMYYLPGWDTRLQTLTDPTRAERITQLGGWRHPYHMPGRPLYGRVQADGPTAPIAARVVDAATGNCFVMRWSDWLKFGPFDANALGPGQSEDYALSQKIKKAGGLVATLDPPIAIHCGLVNSYGEPATGWEAMEELITRQLAELEPKLRNEVLIMRPSAAGEQEIGRAYLGIGTEQFKLDVQRAFEQAQRDLQESGYSYLKPAFRLDADPAEQAAAIADIERRNPHMKNIELPLGARHVALNIGSGQRPFKSTPELYWLNVDSQSVEPDRVPDIRCDVGKEPLPMPDASVRYVVLHQVLEHFGCGEAAPMLRECWRVLAPTGSLIITVPDMRALAGRWLGGEISTQIWYTNVYGAYMGNEADRHKWGFDYTYLVNFLRTALGLMEPGCEICGTVGEPCIHSPAVQPFDWRQIPGADIARDWWVLAVEVVKP